MKHIKIPATDWNVERKLSSLISSTPRHGLIYERFGVTLDLIHPVKNAILFNNTALFDIKKAISMLDWYLKADTRDRSIVSQFPEYEKCFFSTRNGTLTDEGWCNSNYGQYVFGGSNSLWWCIETLTENPESRHACIMINSREAMLSHDKLCTNAIQFIINKNNELEVIIQMRSSNALTLLPYDNLMFCIFTLILYAHLKEIRCGNLKLGYMTYQIACLHTYKGDVENKLGENAAGVPIKDTETIFDLEKIEAQGTTDNIAHYIKEQLWNLSKSLE